MCAGKINSRVLVPSKNKAARLAEKTNTNFFFFSSSILLFFALFYTVLTHDHSCMPIPFFLTFAYRLDILNQRKEDKKKLCECVIE